MWLVYGTTDKKSHVKELITFTLVMGSVKPGRPGPDCATDLWGQTTQSP